MVKLKYIFYNTIFLMIRTYIILLMIIIVFWIWIDFDAYWVKFMSGGYLFATLPALYLHIEYLKANKNVSYQISEKEIVVIGLKGRSQYLVEDLHRIILYVTPTKFKQSTFTTWPIEEFYYARIITKKGEELIITCLYNADIKKFEEDLRILKDVEYIRRKEIFCTLSLGYRG